MQVFLKVGERGSEDSDDTVDIQTRIDESINGKSKYGAVTRDEVLDMSEVIT